MSDEQKKQQSQQQINESSKPLREREIRVKNENQGGDGTKETIRSRDTNRTDS